MHRRDPRVLLVEDNDLDAEKVVRAFAKLGVERPVTRARNGLEGLEMLRAALSPPRARLVRYVVLLDLNMPCMNGFEFLAELRAEPRLARVPVFVLTTSGREVDIVAAHRHHISGYLLKPPTMPEMLETLRIATRFWDLSHLPQDVA